jgi:hypothetical protein
MLQYGLRQVNVMQPPTAGENAGGNLQSILTLANRGKYDKFLKICFEIEK